MTAAKQAYWRLCNKISTDIEADKRAIVQHPNWAYYYARDVIEGRWPEAEPFIMQDPARAYYYARDVIEGRWPEAEPVIKQSAKWAMKYSNFIKTLDIHS